MVSVASPARAACSKLHWAKLALRAGLVLLMPNVKTATSPISKAEFLNLLCRVTVVTVSSDPGSELTRKKYFGLGIRTYAQKIFWVRVRTYAQKNNFGLGSELTLNRLRVRRFHNYATWPLLLLLGGYRRLVEL